MTTETNAENLKYKSRFSFILEQMLAFLWTLTWLEKLYFFLQISHELYNDALCYR